MPNSICLGQDAGKGACAARATLEVSPSAASMRKAWNVFVFIKLT